MFLSFWLGYWLPVLITDSATMDERHSGSIVHVEVAMVCGRARASEASRVSGLKRGTVPLIVTDCRSAVSNPIVVVFMISSVGRRSCRSNFRRTKAGGECAEFDRAAAHGEAGICCRGISS
jgi:hypothetical protein